MISTRELKKEDREELEKLFTQLTDKKINFNPEFLIEHTLSHCRVMEDEGKIIGFGALIIHPVPVKGLVARIEDVVVDEGYRGQGLGRKLMEDLISIAEREGINTINLTSNPERIPARKLYESMGFKLSDTGVFKLNCKK